MMTGLVGSVAAMSALDAAFPPSFGGSLELYVVSLGSITALACMEMMVVGWMARDIWRDRYYVHPTAALMLYRLIILFAALAGFLRKLPEIVYMYSWNEVNERTLSIILTFKRMADAFVFMPGSAWIVLLVLSYPTIANVLKNEGNQGGAVLSPWPSLIRPGVALLLVFTIAPLVAVSKLYLGLQDQ